MDDLAVLSALFVEAVRDRDVDWLDAHLGSEFTLTTKRAGQPARTRSEWLRITGELYEITEFVFDELEALDYGTVGLVRSRSRQVGSLGGDDRTQSFLMTDVWVERAGVPQLVTRHISPFG